MGVEWQKYFPLQHESTFLPWSKRNMGLVDQRIPRSTKREKFCPAKAVNQYTKLSFN